MAKADTIQKDVSEKAQDSGEINDAVEAAAPVVEQAPEQEQEKAQEVEKAASKKNPRRAVMEEIAARRAAELAPQDDIAGSDEAEKVEKPAEGKEAKQAPIFDRDGVWMTRVKVNGVEEEIPLDKVTARYQKDAAGDEKLRAAAEKERELVEKARQLQAYEAHVRQLQEKQALNQPSDKSDVGSLSVSEKELASAFYSGDEKSFASAMKAFRESLKADLTASMPRQEAIDPRAIAKQVEREIAQQDAVQKFHDEFKDVASDPYLLQLADTFSAQLLAQEPSLKPSENLRKSGEMVRNWLAERGVKAPAPEVTTNEKQERKVAASARVASASNVRASVGKDAPTPMKPSDVIAEMRRARGQPV